ncbi:hypothetical protein BDD12DRAFT_983700 [Trichophaea hybrida]|nr:hypothetical protein BDD12DRAFT_983700 [Trichophaea hybrida]
MTKEDATLLGNIPSRYLLTRALPLHTSPFATLHLTIIASTSIVDDATLRPSAPTELPPPLWSSNPDLLTRFFSTITKREGLDNSDLVVLLNFLPFVPIHGGEAYSTLIDTILNLDSDLLRTFVVLVRVALTEARSWRGSPKRSDSRSIGANGRWSHISLILSKCEPLFDALRFPGSNESSVSDDRKRRATLRGRRRRTILRLAISSPTPLVEDPRHSGFSSCGTNLFSPYNAILIPVDIYGRFDTGVLFLVPVGNVTTVGKGSYYNVVWRWRGTTEQLSFFTTPVPQSPDNQVTSESLLQFPLSSPSSSPASGGQTPSSGPKATPSFQRGQRLNENRRIAHNDRFRLFKMLLGPKSCGKLVAP